jgi:hypothetical protein
MSVLRKLSKKKKEKPKTLWKGKKDFIYIKYQVNAILTTKL